MDLGSMYSFSNLNIIIILENNIYIDLLYLIVITCEPNAK